MDHSKQLGEAPVSDLLMRFSIPAIIGMLVNATYNVVDRIFIGHGVGSIGIAAITVGFPLMILIMSFGLLMGLGASALISIRLGEGHKEQAELVMGNALALLIIFLLLLTVCGILFLDPLLSLFGADAQLLPYAREYVKVILSGSVFMGVGFGMNNIIRAEGNPHKAMTTMLLGAILNILLTPLFIFGFNWGISGAAWGTVIAQAASCAWVLAYFIDGKESVLKLHAKNLKIQPYVFRDILAIGLAPFSMEFISAILTVVVNITLIYYGGNMALTAIGIINSVALLIVIPVFGIYEGAQPIIGYNYGAEKFNRVKQTLKLAVLAATGTVTVGFIIVQSFAEQIITSFSPDPEIIHFGARAMRIFMLLLPVVGAQIISAGYFQAIDKPKPAMLLMLSRQLLLMALVGIVLPPIFGLNGVLYAGPAADSLAAILTGIALYYELQHLEKMRGEVKAL